MRGSTIVFTANPIAGAAYQFKLNGGNVPAGDVSGNVYTTNSITSQSTVTVLITNALGCSDTATNTILVPLVSDPGSINPPADVTLCTGNSLGNMASGGALATVGSSLGTISSYQWQIRTSIASGWQNIDGATSAALDVSSTPVSVNANTGLEGWLSS